MGKTIAIIGAGPAGLSLAYTLKKSGVEFMIFESGKAIEFRDHSRGNDLSVGVGGAGLYSDGKFSYYPSATNLYKLAPKKLLKQAYLTTIEILKQFNIPTEEWPTNQHHAFSKIKVYPSYYASLEKRTSLISYLQNSIKDNLTLNTTITHVVKKANKYQLTCIDQEHSSTYMVECEILILATGKLGVIDFKHNIHHLQSKFIRYEFGIRLLYPHSEDPFFSSQYADTKFIHNTNIFQIRTFCTCKNGELWNINYGDKSSISGRSDIKSTGYDNFGLLLRYLTQDDKTDTLWKEVLSFFNGPYSYYQDTEEFLGIKFNENYLLPTACKPYNNFQYKRLDLEMSLSLYSDIRKALEVFLNSFPIFKIKGSFILFPAIEGIGYYPYLSMNKLKINHENIYSVGDCSGIFRGIFASLLSGFYCGLNLINNEIN